MRDAVRRIKPDIIQLNTVARPPAEISAKPVSSERMKEIRELFGNNAEIIASYESESKKTSRAGIDDVREYLRRRPGSLDDISSALGIEKHETENIIGNLVDSDEIMLKDFFGKRFWEYKSRLS